MIAFYLITQFNFLYLLSYVIISDIKHLPIEGRLFMGMGAEKWGRDEKGVCIIITVMDSLPGDMKTESKRQVEKVEVSFEDNIFHGRKFKLKFFPWIRTSELKKLLVKEKFNDKHTHLTEHDIRLFFKNIELTHENRTVFEFYKIESGSTIVIMKNANSQNL